MDNKYLDFLQSNSQAQRPVDQPQQIESNPYSEFLQSENKKALRSSMLTAMDVEPDAAGKARKLAEKTGLPPAVIERNIPDVERQVQLQQFDGLVTESPRLANQLRSPDFAKIARDDVDVLKRMESKLYGGMKSIERGFFGAITEPIQRGFLGARRLVSVIANELGLYDGDQEEFAVNLGQRNRAVERFPVPANVADGLAEITQAKGFGQAAGAIVRNPQSVLEVTLESLGASVPALGLAAAGSFLGPAGTAAGAGVGSFATEYSSTINEVITERGGSTTDPFAIGRAMANPEVMEAAREKGLKRGIPIALFDALTAGLAGRLLAGATSAKGSVAARTAGELGVQAGGGAAGEATGQALTGEFNPGEILLEAFAEIPSAVIEVPANYRDARGAARMRDTIAAAEKVQQQVQAQVNQAQGAEQNAQTLRDLAADSATSKARERDPKAFEAYIDRVVEDGPVQDLYIDAQTLVNKLNQSGISIQELSQASPSFAAQLPEALAAGGDIVIPVSEYMARVAGTGLDEALIPSLRTDVSAMSEEQAQVFYQEQTQIFQQEAERVIGQQAQADEFTESADQVETQLLEQLNKAGRFQPRANELKASFAKSFYSTLADTLGVAPSEAFARYPLQIRSDFLPDLAGGGRFDQSTKTIETPEFKNWFGDSKVVDAEGKPLVVYHGTTGDFNAFSAEKLGATTGAASANKGFFFTDDADVASGYSEIGSDREPVRGEYSGPEPTYQEVETLLSIAKQGGSSIYENPITGKKEMFPINRVANAQQLKALRDSMQNGKSFKDALEIDGSIALAELFGGDYTLVDGVNGANVVPVFLSIKNPLQHDFKGDPYREVTYNDLLKKAKAEGRDGAIFYNTFDEAVKREDSKPHTVYVAFDPTQAKSATGNRGTFDPNDPNILNQGERGSIAFAGDITKTPSVLTLAAGSDLSTFFHESGHFFLEVYSDLATRPDAPARVQKDIAAILNWMGIQGSPELTPLQQWREMSLDERRPMHEKFARGWEAYLIKGEAPSLELRDAFRTFSAWIKNVYKDLLAQFRGNADKALDTNLSPEIRQVMDRMLATDAQIQQAEFARSMFPTFQTAEEAGMNVEQWEEYQAKGKDATATATEQLQRKSLADMKWFANAKGKAIREMQRRAKNVRAQVRTDVRREVMTQPVYQAWAFFRSRMDMPANKPKPKAQNRELNPAVDSLFVAIGMLGGLDKGQLVGTWGFDPADRAESGVFGKPVVRVNKGRTLDDMLGVLAEWGYLPVDENGKPDLRDFEEAFFNELAGEPQYSMWADYRLQRPEDDAPEVAFDLANVPSGKISTGWLKAKYNPDEAWRKLVSLKMTSEATGLDPDVVAPAFDFDSGDAMVKALIAAEDPSAVIEKLTDERMLQQFSELATPQQIERAAEAAIHNEARARFVATELEAVNQANNVREKTTRGGTVNVIMKAAREFAEDILSRKKLRDIKPGQFANAEAKAGREADAAQKAGDYNTMAQAKRNQLLNTYAARGAVKALEEIDRARRFLLKFNNETTRQSIDHAYRDQIDQLLEGIELRQISNKEIDRRKALAEFIESQEDLGLPVIIDQALIEKAQRKAFKELTLQEMRGMVDAVKNIEHLGRLKNRLLKAKDAKAFAAVAEEIAATIRENGGNAQSVPIEEERGGFAAKRNWLKSFLASSRKLGSMVQQMEGGKDGGLFWDTFVRTMNESSTVEVSMLENATVQLGRMFNDFEKQAGKLSEKVYIDAIGQSLSREGRVAIALNWGNETSRRRILDGEKWSPGQAQAVLDTLTKEEWDFVQSVWDYINTFWPMVAEKEKRLTGVVPEKVEAVKVTTKFGEYAGGYYPIEYDPRRDDGKTEQQDAAQAAKDMMRGAVARSQTRRGHLEQRVDQVNRAVRKDLNVIPEHLRKVIHDLAWHEWLIDANRLMNDSSIKNAVVTHYGNEVLRMFKDNILAIATQDVTPMDATDRLLLGIRSNISRSIMGISFTTAFLQPFGLLNSVSRIGPKAMAQGMSRWIGDAARMESSLKWVGLKSEFMRLRAKTFNREISEISNRLKGKSKAAEVVDASLFYLTTKMQLAADVPTWIGAYEKALAENANDEARAIALADQAVLDSQGGGEVKDLAGVQRKHPFLAQFYTYFSTTWNLIAQRTGNTDFKNPAATAGWLASMALLVIIPAIGPELLKSMLKGDLEDDEPEDLAEKMVRWQVGYLMGMFVGLRELSGPIAGFDYAGPPVGRLAVDLGNAAKQTGQAEVDEPLVLAYARLMGSAFGIPSTQIIRSYKGWVAWEEGDAPATSILLGPPSKD